MRRCFRRGGDGCNRALAVLRFRAGKKKVAPQLQRMQSDDLLALCFPDQVACLENIAGDRQIPDHPLVQQTIYDCLHEAMDIDAFENLLQEINEGRKTLIAKDLTEPSPLAYEILNAKPYAFLDDAPLEERRTRAVQARRHLDPREASDLGALDTAAIDRVRSEAWPDPANADELHDALYMHAFIADTDPIGTSWAALFRTLQSEGRVRNVNAPNGRTLWIAEEHAEAFTTMFSTELTDARSKSIVDAIRGRLEALGPTTADSLSASIGISRNDIDQALMALQSEGFAIQGHFDPRLTDLQWCDRRLLARIHRYTLKRLRAEIQPVSVAAYMRFLFSWQHATEAERLSGPRGLLSLIEQLQGVSAPAGSWETDIFPVRMNGYDPTWLDALCLGGQVSWMRRRPMTGQGSSNATKSTPVRTSPIAIVPRPSLTTWQRKACDSETLSADAQAALVFLRERGASFFNDIVSETRGLRTRVEQGLGELVNAGLVTADGFAGLRALLMTEDRKHRQKRQPNAIDPMLSAGRWTALVPTQESLEIETIARMLLHRWGVVFRRLIDREDHLPSWRELLYAFRRLEARGEIRGGRFIDGPTGEQFALPEALKPLRACRHPSTRPERISISAADPLNLIGSVFDGPKVPSLASNRLLFENGTVVAIAERDEVRFLQEVDEPWEAQKQLNQAPRAPLVRAYLGNA
ncbi:MAG: hypothetical protein R3A47_02720 [Polyangiales bacterium]